jgi:protein-S-isoprenylcysteine O-methyltransferase Ste14
VAPEVSAALDTPSLTDDYAAVLRDLAARTVIVGLYTLLLINLLADFHRTGRTTGLLLLASESLVVVFTVVRRRAQLVDRSITAGAITVISLAGPPLLRASGVNGPVPDVVTTGVSAGGLALVIIGKLALGRSFGIVPANRGVVRSGPYALVRHPIYAGYLVTHIAFVVANPRPWNVAVVLVSDLALVARALMEERLLAGDRAYAAYCRSVEWHLVPGIF